MMKCLSTLLVALLLLAAPAVAAEDFPFGDVERGFVETLLIDTFNKDGDCTLGVEESVGPHTYTSDFLCTNSPVVRNIRFEMSPASSPIGPKSSNCLSWKAEADDNFDYGAICSVNSETRNLFVNYVIRLELINQ